MSACYCDYEQPEFISTADRMARRPHLCDECGCDIRPGERYEAVAGKWDGIMSSFATCERCRDFRQWFSANRPCFCWAYSNMFDDVRDQLEYEAYDLLREAPGFLFEAGRKLVAIRRRRDADRKARMRIAS